VEDITLQQVVRAGFSDLRRSGGVRSAVIGWCYSVLSCRTRALGGHVWRCPEGHEEVVLWNSCKHRACAACGALDRERWLDRVRQVLSLDCGYHHIVFTVPHELNILWRYNRSWFAAQVLAASRETLLQLMSQEKWLGALPGVVQSWQTWGRSLIDHLHVHVLMTAGGWTSTGWRSLKYDYVAPTSVLRGVYRGKLGERILRGLSSGEMVLPPEWTSAEVHRVLGKLYRKEWCVHVQPRYAHGQGVLTYLSRYVRGGPLRSSQLQSLSSTHVEFQYSDHRDKGRQLLRLGLVEFLRRLGEHVPEPGFRGVRYCGLYAPGNRSLLSQSRTWLGMGPLPAAPKRLTVHEYLKRIGQGDKLSCETCGKPYEQAEKIEPADRGPPLVGYERAA